MRRVLVCLLFLLLAGTASAQTTVILVRHAEKAAAPADDPPLTEAGRERAQRLVERLRDANITVVYSTPYARTRETAAPLAEALGLKVIETPNARGFAAQMAERIRRENVGKTVLVVGHSNTTPEVVSALTGIAVPQMPDAEHDHLYVVTIAPDGKASLIRGRY